MATATHRLRMLGTPLEEDPCTYGQCVGSYKDWLVCTKLHWIDGACFLLNPLSSRLIPLPNPSASHPHGTVRRSIPLSGGFGEITCGFGEITCTMHAPQYAMALSKVVLSCAPEEIGSPCTCIVAAISQKMGEYRLAFCRLEAKSWCICEGSCIKRYVDIEFYEGKLYVVDARQGNLFAFEFEEYKSFSPVVSRAERCVVQMAKVHLADDSDRQGYNLVQSQGKLLLVVRYFSGDLDQFVRARVFALEFDSDPWRWSEIKGLECESILISTSSSKSFIASDCDEIEEGNIILLDHFCHNFIAKDTDTYSYGSQVYDMKDDMIRPFLIGTGPMKQGSGYPLWFCPQ